MMVVRSAIFQLTTLAMVKQIVVVIDQRKKRRLVVSTMVSPSSI